MPRLVEERGTVAGSYHISLSDQVATLDGYPLAGDAEEGFADALRQLSREAAAMPEDHHLVVRVADDRPAGYKPARARLYGGQSLEPADFPRKDRPMGMAGTPLRWCRRRHPRRRRRRRRAHSVGRRGPPTVPAGRRGRLRITGGLTPSRFPLASLPSSAGRTLPRPRSRPPHLLRRRRRPRACLRGLLVLLRGPVRKG